MKKKNRSNKLTGINDFDKLLDTKYGKTGTPKRNKFEKEGQYFIISEVLKDARRKARLTQTQLADKVGTKKSYISRLENGNCDIQLSTLYRIFNKGLKRKVNITIT